MDWFLYDNVLRHERVKEVLSRQVFNQIQLSLGSYKETSHLFWFDLNFFLTHFRPIFFPHIPRKH